MSEQFKICDLNGKDQGTLDAPESLNVTPRRDVLHRVVVWQMAKKRQWNAHTKTRSEKAGGGAKPWRQKGTGRARAGSRRSPLWRGGGVTFGPRKKNIKPGLPKKVRQLGLRMALADRLSNDSVRIIKDLQFDSPNLKQAQSLIAALGASRTLVIVGDGRQQKGVASDTERSFRNLDRVRVLQAEGINVYDILKSDMVLIAENAVDYVVGRISSGEVA